MLIEDEEIFFVNYEKDPKKIIVYAPLRSYLCLIDQNISKLIITENKNDYKRDFFSRLKQRKKIDIMNLYEQIKKVEPELSIAITDNCNLNCRYCHASAGEGNKQSNIDKKLFTSIVESYLSTSATKSPRIVFMGGGEPTSNINFFKWAVEYIKDTANDHGKPCKIRMATNGCFSEDLADYIVNSFSEISLSFDGPDFIQNYHRPFKNGKNTFPMIFSSASFFQKKKFPFALRTTVSSYSVNYLKEIVDFFSQNFPNRTVGFEPLNPYGRALKDTELIPPNKAVFAEKLVEAYKYAEGKPIRLMNAGVGKFETLRTVFCGAIGIPSWTININGEISSCTRDNCPEEFKFGNYDILNERFNIDQEKVKKLERFNVFQYEECTNCFCKYHCAGDCPDLRLSKLHNCDANQKIGIYVLNKKICV